MNGKDLFDMSVNGQSLSESQREYLVIVDDPEANQLADLVSIKSDLDGALAACTLFSEEAKKKNADTVLLRIFLESAIISYARPFSSGKGSGEKRTRRKIDNLLESFDQEQQAAHDKAVSIRNQHVGHRVDPDEQSAMVLAAFDQRSLRFKSVNPFLMDRIDGSLMVNLARCVEILNEVVENEISKEINQLTRMYETQEAEERLRLPQALANIDRNRS